MIQIKDHKVLDEVLKAEYHPKLRELLTWFCCRYSSCVMTSGYRKGDPGVHGTKPCRGADMRSRVFEDPEGVVADINAHWTYDPERPDYKCAVLHDTGSGKHIHLQAHNNTTYNRG